MPNPANILTDRNPWWADPGRRLGVPATRRLVQPVIAQRVRGLDRRAALLVGPRQVGKTVILKQTANDLLDEGFPAANLAYFDFSDDRLGSAVPSIREVLAYRPPAFVEAMPRIALLDEVGKAPSWAEWLKQVVDEGSHRVIATDSAATLLRTGSRESGQGRWDEYRIEGLTYREFLLLQARPGEGPAEVAARLPNPLERYLRLGGFPEHVGNESLETVRQRIRIDAVDRAILRDLSAEDVDLQRVRDLFVFLVEDSGGIFDADARQRLLARPGVGPADRRSIERWIHLLEDTLLIVRLDPYGGAATSRLAGKARPKLYAADHGLVSAFAAYGPSGPDESTRGRLIEAAVFRHLRDIGPERLTYYRSARGQLEIDFVVQREGACVAVEVTANRDPSAKAAQLGQRANAVKATRAVVLHGGAADQVTESGVRTLPLETFFLEPRSIFDAA